MVGTNFPVSFGNLPSSFLIVGCVGRWTWCVFNDLVAFIVHYLWKMKNIWCKWCEAYFLWFCQNVIESIECRFCLDGAECMDGIIIKRILFEFCARNILYPEQTTLSPYSFSREGTFHLAWPHKLVLVYIPSTAWTLEHLTMQSLSSFTELPFPFTP